MDRLVAGVGVRPGQDAAFGNISHTGLVRAARAGERTAAKEGKEKQREVFPRLQRPWKFLRDFHTPAARLLLIDKRNQSGPMCHHLIALQRVSA